MIETSQGKKYMGPNSATAPRCVDCKRVGQGEIWEAGAGLNGRNVIDDVDRDAVPALF